MAIKINYLKKIQKDRKLNFDIEIDGGINFENSKAAIEAGANILVSGTTIFKNNITWCNTINSYFAAKFM